MSLTAIILAAGKSTRMKSDVPKPLHEVCGKPMLAWILDAVYAAGADRVLVVVGHGKEAVIDAFRSDSRLTFVEQTEQLGTGHAAKVCLPHLHEDATDVMILAGDTPLVRGDSLKQLVAEHREQSAEASMATAVLENPFGYGRVIRNVAGDFERIVEQADASPEQAAVKECFPSLYCVRKAALVDALDRLRNENAKGEYYLTDIFELVKAVGGKVHATSVVTADDIIAPNTRAQLADADTAMQVRLQDALLNSGVSIVSRATTYIQANVTVGSQTVLHPFSYIGKGSVIGDRCVIGPFAHLPAGTAAASGRNSRACGPHFQRRP